MKEDVFGTRGVLENRENGCHGATKVGDIDGHCHMDCIIGAHVGGCCLLCLAVNGWAVWGVVEFRSFLEALSSGRGPGLWINGGEEAFYVARDRHIHALERTRLASLPLDFIPPTTDSSSCWNEDGRTCCRKCPGDRMQPMHVIENRN